MKRMKYLSALLGVSFIASVMLVEGQIRENKEQLEQLSTEMDKASKWAKYTPTEISNIICEVSQNNVQKFEVCDTQEQIDEEIRLGEMEMLAQLIQAEAGNQDLKGKQLVADVVLNRLDDGWANSLEEVIFQEKQFSTTKDGAFDRAAWNMTAEDFEASELEYNAKKRIDDSVFYFTAGNYNDSGHPAYKYGDHYFSRK